MDVAPLSRVAAASTRVASAPNQISCPNSAVTCHGLEEGQDSNLIRLHVQPHHWTHLSNPGISACRESAALGFEAWTIDPSANGHIDLETLAWMNDDLPGWPR